MAALKVLRGNSCGDYADEIIAEALVSVEKEMNRQKFGSSEPLDLEAIRQSPRQFVDLDTVEKLSDYAMVCELKIERLTAELVEIKEAKAIDPMNETYLAGYNAAITAQNVASTINAPKAQSEPVAEVIGQVRNAVYQVKTLCYDLPAGMLLYDFTQPAKQSTPVACVADFNEQVREQFLADGYLLSDGVYTTPQPAQDKDAERYRFLRYCDLDAMCKTYWPDSEVPTGLDFDAAIDAAIAKQKDPK